jgi:hypothetical protein
MGKKRKLKKVCCDLEIEEQNVVASELELKSKMLFH